MVGLAQPVVNPATFATLVHQTGCLEHLEVPADVGLGDIEGVNELADAGSGRHCKQAAGETQPDAVAQCGEEVRDITRHGMHIFQFMNM